MVVGLKPRHRRALTAVLSIWSRLRKIVDARELRSQLHQQLLHDHANQLRVQLVLCVVTGSDTIAMAAKLPPTKAPPGSAPPQAKSTGAPNQTLYISNLPDKIQKVDLRRSLYMLFSTYGPVLDVVAMRTAKMRGQAHIVFRDVQTSTQAMRSLQGFEFFGRELVSLSSSFRPWNPC